MATAVDGKTRRLVGEARQARIDAERAEAALLAHEAAARQAKLLDPHPKGCPSPPLAAVWDPITQRLREQVDPATYHTWLEGLHPHRVEHGVLVVALKPHLVGWVRERFGRLIEWAAEKPVRLVGCNQFPTNQTKEQ